ncbi:serine hydrolase domain-containing protein [Nonomuraea sp. NPDC052265]|uniref:serine hydrolase domain-containing protein n=1 Tax=Nonomuraea sp. NPDC052265 TaxID=3364374 RepID=UPI0037CA2D67
MPMVQAGRPRLRRVLDRLAADDRGPGIVAEVRDGREPPWFGAAGVADLETGRPRTPGEHFRIGSFTKAFVGTVVLGLAADGRLALDAPVTTWLPGVVEQYFPGADAGRITPRLLLNHTSGLPDALPGQENPPVGEPGRRFVYSKVNYNLAGMIVEAVSGSTLAEEIDRRVAGPLGLTGTYLPAAGEGLRDPHARHYSGQDETGQEVGRHDVTDADLSWAWAAGGMVSTTADLHRFLTALLGGHLLPPQQQEEMFTTVSTEGADWVPGTRYGLGVYSQHFPSGVTLWGGGGFIQGSMTYAMGDRQGTHTLTGNVNGDWGDFLETCADLFQADFR